MGKMTKTSNVDTEIKGLDEPLMGSKSTSRGCPTSSVIVVVVAKWVCTAVHIVRPILNLNFVKQCMGICLDKAVVVVVTVGVFMGGLLSGLHGFVPPHGT